MRRPPGRGLRQRSAAAAKAAAIGDCLMAVPAELARACLRGGGAPAGLTLPDGGEAEKSSVQRKALHECLQGSARSVIFEDACVEQHQQRVQAFQFGPGATLFKVYTLM